MPHQLTPLQRILFFISVSLATFMIVLDYSIANVSIPYIAGDLGVSTDQGTYVITSFAVGNAIGLALTGWLTKRVGEIKLFTLSIALFTFFSWLCGCSFTFDMLVISRFIQGLVAGPVIPLSQTLIISYGTPESRTKDLSIWTAIVIAAPVVGPIMGGYISDWYIWTWIFYMNIPVGIFCTIAVWMLLRKDETKIEKVPSDIWGIILLAVGVTCLQIFLDKGEDWDWFNSELIIALMVGTVVCFTYLIIREFWHKNPFLKLRLFRIPSFTISIICLMVSYGIYFGTIVLIPLWLQEYMGYNAEWAGFAVCTLGIGPLMLAVFIPKLIHKFGNQNMLIISMFIFGAASFYNAFFTTAIDVQNIAFARFFFGVGLACYFNPLVAISVQDIPPEQLPNATGIFHFVRAIMGGVGTSVFTTLWIRRTIFHHERVGEALTVYNPITPEANTSKSLALLNNSLDVESAVLALNDAFWVMGWLFVGLILLLFGWKFYSRGKSPTAAGPPIHVSAE